MALSPKGQGNGVHIWTIKMDLVTSLKKAEISFAEFSQKMLELEIKKAELEQFQLHFRKGWLWLYYRGNPKRKVNAIFITSKRTRLSACLN